MKITYNMFLFKGITEIIKTLRVYVDFGDAFSKLETLV